VRVVNAVAGKLREARALIERGWCQWHMSTADGCVCIRGALLNTFTEDEEAEERQADALLHKATGFGGYLGDWNDTPGRTQAEVLAAFDKAIELAEATQ
jgi:hypothetical protein